MSFHFIYFFLPTLLSLLWQWADELSTIEEINIYLKDDNKLNK